MVFPPKEPRNQACLQQTPLQSSLKLKRSVTEGDPSPRGFILKKQFGASLVQSQPVRWNGYAMCWNKDNAV